MRRSTKRAGIAVEQFLFHVPRDVAERLRGTHISVDCPAMGGTPARIITAAIGINLKGSLHTRDADVAASRRLLIITQLDKVCAAARSGTGGLAHKQMIALAGEVYALLRANFDDDPGDMESWAAWKGFVRAAREGRIPAAPSITPGELADERADAARLFGPDLTAGINALPPSGDRAALEDRCGRLAWWVLNRHGLYIDRPTRLRLLEHVADACLEAGWALKRAAGGDYTPDPKAARFPKFESPSQKAAVSLGDLFDRWARETKPAGSTLTTWRGITADFVKSLGHDDVTRVLDTDVVRWKDGRISAGRAAKTVNDSDLACLRALFRYGVTNKLITANPAEGVKVSAKKKAGTGRLPYSDDEIARLLAHAEGETSPIRRWLPILLVTTGARVGEITQLSADRVRNVDGVPCLVIEPAEDGGSLKTEGSERTVPMHPVLLASGFMEFVEGRRGPLFYGESRGREGGRHASKGSANRFSEWVRTLPSFDNPRKAPSHSLRHWWKSTAARIGMLDSVADHIQGHVEGGAAAAYRHHNDLRSLAAALAKIPVPVRCSASNSNGGE